MGEVARRFGWLVALVAAIWALVAVNWVTGGWLSYRFGLDPRDFHGLDGILGMPLLHADAGHAAANTPPLLALGGLFALTARRAILAVNAVIVGLGGALVWIFARDVIHVGASGLIFGWFGFLLARGIVDRSPKTLGVAALVALAYGAMIWGVLPGRPGVSWEGHLFGFVAGVVAAWVIRARVDDPGDALRRG